MCWRLRRFTLTVLKTSANMCDPICRGKLARLSISKDDVDLLLLHHRPSTIDLVLSKSVEGTTANQLPNQSSSFLVEPYITTMTQHRFIGLLFLLGFHFGAPFVLSSVESAPKTLLAASTADVGEELGSTTFARDNYDEVKVDLDDGRDYPIYIGTGYSEEEGESFPPLA